MHHVCIIYRVVFDLTYFIASRKNEDTVVLLHKIYIAKHNNLLLLNIFTHMV